MFSLTKGAFLMATAAIAIHTPIPTDAFTIVPLSSTTSSTSTRPINSYDTILHSEKSSSSSSSPSSSSSTSAISATTTDDDTIYQHITLHDKITIRDASPEERGKGGVQVDNREGIKALEVLARIPRNLILSTSVEDDDDSGNGNGGIPLRAMEAASAARNITWATGLVAATLAACHPTDDELSSDTASTDFATVKKEWISSWNEGGWGTNAIDLGPDIADSVTGTLVSTGSDNDFNIYAKFRMPCHPAVFKASLGLEVLTGCTVDEARCALARRGFTFRSMRDALQELVLASTVREKKGSFRDKRCWDVADIFSKVLSRVTTLQLDGDDAMTHAVVPVHERLAHSLDANTKLVSIDNEILLVATRDIGEGESITRDYTKEPRVKGDEEEESMVVEEEEGSALRLLLQFGLPPDAWPTTTA